MADNEKSNVSSDLATSAHTAKAAAEAAMAAGKAVAKAASGNVVGAAAEVAKNKTLRNIIIGILVVIFLLPTMMLYAIPSMVFSAAEEFVQNLDEEMMSEIESTGNSFHDFFYKINFYCEKINSLDTYVGKLLVDTIKSIFAPDQKGQNDISYDAYVYNTAFDQDAAIDTIKTQIEKVLSRFDARKTQYAELLKNAADYYRANWQSLGFVADKFIVETEFNAPEVTEYDAIQYISAYSVQRGNGLRDVSLRSLLAWIGYYNGIWTSDCYDFGGVPFYTFKWKGDYLPQYQYEQWIQEENQGIPKTGYAPTSFLDAIYYVDKNTGINIEYEETVEYILVENPLYVPPQTGGGTEPAPSDNPGNEEASSGSTANESATESNPSSSENAGNLDSATSEKDPSVSVSDQSPYIEVPYVTITMTITMDITKLDSSGICDDVMGFWDGDLSNIQSDGANRDVSVEDPYFVKYSWISNGHVFNRMAGFQIKYFEDLQETTARYIGLK